MKFFDQEGQEITLEQWGEAYEDIKSRTIDRSDVQMPDGTRVTVMTVWLGTFDAERCCSRLFGTAVRYRDGEAALTVWNGNPAWVEARHYDDRASAQKGHADVVVLLRGGTRPEPVHPRGESITP